MNAESFSILAVDDNELNLGLFKLFLRQLGHTVTAVNNPEEAIKLVSDRSDTFDLIFTDIQMPGMTGIEASDKFRSSGFTGPIIAITAHLSAVEQQRIFDSTISDVLIKPVTKPELIRVLTNWLGSQGQETLKVESTQATYHAEAHYSEQTYDIKLALTRSNESTSIAQEMLSLLHEHLKEVQAQITGETNQTEFRDLLHKLMGGVRFTGAARLESKIDMMQSNVDRLDHVSATTLIQQEVQAVLTWIEENPAPFED